jgi:hypothetical protein
MSRPRNRELYPGKGMAECIECGSLGPLALRCWKLGAKEAAFSSLWRFWVCFECAPTYVAFTALQGQPATYTVAWVSQDYKGPLP